MTATLNLMSQLRFGVEDHYMKLEAVSTIFNFPLVVLRIYLGGKGIWAVIDAYFLQLR